MVEETKDWLWPWRGGSRKDKLVALGYLGLLFLGWGTFHALGWWIAQCRPFSDFPPVPQAKKRC